MSPSKLSKVARRCLRLEINLKVKSKIETIKITIVGSANFKVKES